MPDGTLVSRERGSPQGSVVSPVLANLFLHYAFDCWMRKQYPDIPFERYADDAICHCRSETQARALHDALEARLAECKLQLHPQKTKIVYCKDANRRGSYPEQGFDFLGFTFRPRRAKNRTGKLFVSFAPAVSNKAAKAMRTTIRRWRLHRRSDLDLGEIAQKIRPVVRGWIQYYARFYPSALHTALRTLNHFFVRWAKPKTPRLRTHTERAWDWLNGIQSRQPNLFPHWSSGSPVGR
jgi:hypothetical protein